MRLIDRDLIRGGHYGQRSREPRSKAEHMAAPTNAALVKKTLANSEPSTHGPSRPIVALKVLVANGGIADVGRAHLGNRLASDSFQKISIPGKLPRAVSARKFRGYRTLA
jgi:hypothetical protein